MATKKKPLVEVISPFQAPFKEPWEKWKAFKKEQFRFTYKPIGEQAALDDLFEMSAGNESMAEAIIKQSIKNGWRGLFDIKQQNNGAKNFGFTKEKPIATTHAKGGYGKL